LNLRILNICFLALHTDALLSVPATSTYGSARVGNVLQLQLFLIRGEGTFAGSEYCGIMIEI
jgi:hypothetical protein